MFQEFANKITVLQNNLLILCSNNYNPLLCSVFTYAFISPLGYIHKLVKRRTVYSSELQIHMSGHITQKVFLRGT
jgi:hypothetical protein